MLPTISLLPTILLGLFQAQVALANPIVYLRPLHTCTVFVQRWYDSSFDVYTYGVQWSPGVNSRAILTTESTAMSPGNSMPSPLGSQYLVLTDVANPAVVNGAVVWSDPGKISFVWGTQSWDSYSPGSPCKVTAVGYVRAQNGYPTEYTCFFQCDV